MTPRPLLPWRSALLLAAAVVVAVPIAALWLSPDGDRALLVLAPSSLAPSEDELDAALDRAGIGPVEWVFAGSQSLVAQVADGVPADVVLVADEVANAAVLVADAEFEHGSSFARNHLVLAVAPGNPGAISSLADLADPGRLIGLCSPEVPCGRLAVAALDEFDISPAPDTEETSARALTAKISTGELDAGLIYHSDALAADLAIVAIDGLDAFTNTYFGQATANGLEVLDFLAGDQAQAILAEAGFST